mgnify:FL=1
MCGLRTFPVVACLVLTPLAGAGQTLPDHESPLYRFAQCAGRLSALMEHQWLTDPPASDRTEVLRARMLDLVEAASAPAEAPLALSLRIEAKHAHAALLRAASFGSNKAARRQALRLERDCAAILGLA